MKKSKWFTLCALVTALVAICAFALVGCEDSISDEEYLKRLDGYKVDGEKLFTASYADLMPQTIINKLILDHFATPSEDGKVKKAIFMGYDGYRADGLENILDVEKKNSAIKRVREQGAMYYTFSGGVEGATQATSTAPSWAAMLTGGWGEYNGITDNNQYKKAEVDTFLTALAKQGYKGSFTTSWREHTQKSYFYDIVNAKQEGLPVEYTHQIDDEATLYQVLDYVADPAGQTKTTFDPDVVFFTLEHADHAGHGIGFGNHVPEYKQACKDADAFGAMILDAIETRQNYANEDWLIIVSTDHGGTKTWHGGQSIMERTTWLATNKAFTVTDEYKNFAKK